MEFEADPDYNYLRGLLRTVLQKQNCEYDFYYDWLKEKPVITDEFAIERYTKNNTETSLELPPEPKEKEKEEKTKENENEKENINIEKYNGLKTDIHTEGNKINISNEISKTDGDINNGKDIVPTNSSSKTGDKKDKKSKDKKNKKCIII